MNTGIGTIAIALSKVLQELTGLDETSRKRVLVAAMVIVGAKLTPRQWRAMGQFAELVAAGESKVQPLRRTGTGAP